MTIEEAVAQMQEQIEMLQKKIKGYDEYIEAKANNQLTFPLDPVSKSVISQNVPIVSQVYNGTKLQTGFVTVTINGRAINLLTGA